ncbi:MAG: helix-turn-helix domain-containing protein [Pseudomonadota bacterium]
MYLTMPVLPVPMIIALLLLVFLVQRLASKALHPSLLLLLWCCALQSAVTALVQYYGVAALRPVQPVLAATIPAVAWFAFRQAAFGPTRVWHLSLNAIGPLAAVIAIATHPQALDALIPLLFAGYGLAILIVLRTGEESLPHSRLEEAGLSLLIWRVLAVALLASAITDVFIAVRLAAGDSSVLLWLPSLTSSITLFVLGVLGLSNSAESQNDPEPDPPAYSPEDERRDEAIIEKLDAFVVARKPYVDPDLTLARLARQLHVPEKSLSRAINKRKGENVSRYINAHRVAHACAMLQKGSSVTEAMLASGFNTKSNFNREFLRVQKTSPRLWLQAQPRPTDPA